MHDLHDRRSYSPRLGCLDRSWNLVFPVVHIAPALVPTVIGAVSSLAAAIAMAARFLIVIANATGFGALGLSQD